MENKQRLLQFISHSGLEDEDKKRWADFFDVNSEASLEAYAEIFSMFPAEIVWFNEIMKRKVSAMSLIKNGDEKGQEEMKIITEEEKMKLEELSKRL